MRRRDFVALLGAGTVAWPLSGRAQQSDRLRRIGVLMGLAETDSDGKRRVSILESQLQSLGWKIGGNLTIDYRWAAGSNERFRSYAKELASTKPDAVLATNTAALVALRQEVGRIPIVFVQVTDPAGGGFVADVKRPGGSITGIANPDVSVVGDRLKVLKEIAPKVTRVMVIFEPNYPPVAPAMRVLEETAKSLRVAVVPAEVRNATEFEQAIGAFAREPNGGLQMIQSPSVAALRPQIIGLGDNAGVPGVYPFRAFAVAGGLASYSINQDGMYRQAASYFDRIFKGESPADIPVEQASQLELVINLKTANALGIEIPAAVLARADAVIK